MYEAQIAKGIKLLDEKGPANWRAEINPTTLDMASGYNCILGQIYGHYFRGRDRLFPVEKAPEAWQELLNLVEIHGFQLGWIEDIDELDPSPYDVLRDEWLQALKDKEYTES